MQERTWRQLMKQSKHLPLYSDDGIYLSSTSAPTSYLPQEIHFQKWIISKLTELIELYKKKNSMHFLSLVPSTPQGYASLSSSMEASRN